MHKKILEAALFISTSPITLDQLARVSGINSLGHVKELMESLQKDYEGRGLELLNTSDGWIMQVRPKILPSVAHLTPYSDLREGPKRTLALITLKEPVKQSLIIKTQGNKAYSYIKGLMKRGLITSESEGHTKVLKLTQEFERYFGEEKDKIKEQLQRHLEASSRGGEPVYEKTAPTGGVPGEGQEFTELPPRTEKRQAKEKARVSVIKEEAAKEIPKQKTDEFGGDDEEEEPETEEKGKPRPSHNHAFKEIE